jgi:4-amino-4-deoxy-L-arabinose transferase-like glycosyltransferase
VASETLPSPSTGDPGVAVPHARAERLLMLIRPRHRWVLGGILLLATAADFYALQRNGYANMYYAATVKSMLQSWHNFFFAAFDPGGFVSVDKPPLGFWIQTASAKLLGFSGFSLLLPEALAGVVSVGVLYLLVRRVFGVTAGLLAALALAITPISVVTNRNNTIDSLLVLTVLLAAYAVTRATESGSLRWLLLGALLVGLGFNIKMLEAYLVVPAFAAMYLLGAPLRWLARVGRLALAGLVMLVVSLSWVIAVDLTPAAARPYVGSSGSNSELALALGYNGIERLLGIFFHLPAGTTGAAALLAEATAPGGPGGASENGAAGIFRLLNAQLGGQASWLLALGLLGMLAAGWELRPGSLLRALPDRARAWRVSSEARLAAHLTPRQSALVLWGGWTLTQVAFFSIAAFFHRYYLSMLAPGIAALFGIGVVLLWRDYRAPDTGWRGWLLPVALGATAATQAVILADYTDWNAWMTPLIVGGSLLAAVALVWYRLDAAYAPHARSTGVSSFALAPALSGAAYPEGKAGGSDQWPSRLAYVPMLAAVLGIALLLVGPLTWTGVSLASGMNAVLPAAGPTATFATSGGQPGAFAGRRARLGGFEGGQPPFGVSPSGDFTFPGGSSGGALGQPGQAASGNSLRVDSGLVSYLEAHQGPAEYLFATLSSQTAAPYIIATGKPVMTLGGFSGSDQILSLSQLQALVRAGTVRYFLLDGVGGRGGPGGSGNAQLTQWVESSCSLVPASAYGSASGAGVSGFGAGGGGVSQLYVCAASAA